MAIIKLNYDKEEFNKLMNSLYNVYNFVKNSEDSEDDSIKENIEEVLGSIKKYSIGRYDEDNDEYLYIRVPHTERDLFIIWDARDFASFLDARSYFYTLDEPENIDYYTKFVEEFKAKYEIYKEEKMKKLQQSMDKKEAINRVEKEIEEDNNQVKDEKQTTTAEPL
ncbi:hypothetical protein [uncultured Fenollaria sp.]|uniref:hypothetical protein n=1 Tax=uncultured Fenollaria sp. TaxID=1686315 RepID=UPI0025EFF1F7|nr:hypothetical protein [uncultured Fenollaria sp.]